MKKKEVYFVTVFWVLLYTKWSNQFPLSLSQGLAFDCGFLYKLNAVQIKMSFYWKACNNRVKFTVVEIYLFTWAFEIEPLFRLWLRIASRSPNMKITFYKVVTFHHDLTDVPEVQWNRYFHFRKNHASFLPYKKQNCFLRVMRSQKVSAFFFWNTFDNQEKGLFLKCVVPCSNFKMHRKLRYTHSFTEAYFIPPVYKGKDSEISVQLSWCLFHGYILGKTQYTKTAVCSWRWWSWGSSAEFQINHVPR